MDAAVTARVLRPTHLSEAILMLADGARPLAGGTLARPDGLPRLLLSLDRISELAGVTGNDATTRIGATTTLADLLADRAVCAAQPMLAAALAGVAAPAVRTRASIGGNIAGRAGCLLPVLLAQQARLELAGATGRRAVDLAAYLADPDEAALITAIMLPALPAGARWTQRKIGLRAAFTPSVIGLAGLLELADGVIATARLAVGGGVVRPARLTSVETELSGRNLKEIDPAWLRARLRAAIVAPDDVHRSGAYRRRAGANALAAGLLGTAAGPVAPPAPAVAGPGEILLGRAAHPARWRIRPDLADKIAGRFAYLTDARAPGMLVGRILRAGLAHARILRLDTAAAEALPGVVAVVTHRDVPGLNAYGIIAPDQPALCDGHVRHAGEPVAAVAAIDDATAAAALRLIEVEYVALPALTDPEAALAPGAPALHPRGNLMAEHGLARGDTEAGFAASAHIVESVLDLPRQAHGFMETEGGHARIEPDGTLAIFAGGQYGFRDRLQLARILDRPGESIRVVTSPTGGGFGGKDELTVQPALALLALKSGRAVRLRLDRAESMLASVKRHTMRIRLRTGCDADGRLLAHAVELLADGGAYASLGPAVLETAMEHAAGPYMVANIRARGRMAATNNGLCGAFRGFGANQMTQAVEAQMDRLAARCGLHPAEFRARNLRRPGSPGYLGQGVAPSERLVEMLAAARASPLWARGQTSGGNAGIEGVGMALNHQGSGLGSALPDRGAAWLRLAEDGAIEAAFGLDEMGQGLVAMIRICLAEALGCAPEDVRPVVGDSARTPDSGSTSASRGTFVVWQGTRLAAPGFAAELCEAAAGLLGREAATLAPGPGGIVARGANSGAPLLTYAALAARLGSPLTARAAFEFPKADVSFPEFAGGNARFLFAFGAVVARVRICRDSGMVRVLALHQHSAAGPVVDLAGYLGQIEGGMAQALGHTLSETMPMRDGQALVDNFDGYIMPVAADAPAMAVLALERLDPGDGFGPRGIGELGIGAAGAAIANAVADALGAWPDQLPIRPDWVLDQLERTEQCTSRSS